MPLPCLSTPELSQENADMPAGNEEMAAVVPAVDGISPISLGCPVGCLRAVVPARAFNRIYQLRPVPETIADLVEVCLRGGLDGLRNLGPLGIAEINGALADAGLLREHSHNGHVPVTEGHGPATNAGEGLGPARQCPLRHSDKAVGDGR